jgi:RimJ/RimL family protein N-acetyltransferase
MFARTARLALRPAWPDDAAAVARALDDPGIARNVNGVPSPYTLADAAAFVTAPLLPQYPRLLMIERGSGTTELVGGVGIKPGEDGIPLFGYWVRRDRWGRGYATEASRALLEICDMLRIPRLKAVHFVDNAGSAAVLGKLGFAPVGTPFLHISVGRGEPALPGPDAGEHGRALGAPTRGLKPPRPLRR